MNYSEKEAQRSNVENHSAFRSDGTVTIDDAIDRIGMGPFQHLVLLAAGLCFAADSMEVMLLSFISAMLQHDWGLDATQTASITSSVFAGSLAGSLILGPLGDRWGRRPVFLLCGIIISVFGVLTGFVMGYYPLIVTRFMVGVGVGGLTVPFDILAEFLPTADRGRYLLLIEYYWTAGSLFVPLVASMSLGTSWHLFVLLCAIPCFLSAIVGALFVPESPRWLLSQNRMYEAVDILRKAAKTNGKDENDVFPAGIRIVEDVEESTSFLDLLKPKRRAATLALWGAWIGFEFCYYGTIMLVIRVFGNTEEVGDDENGAVFDYSAILVSSSSEILGVAIVIMTIDRVGRITTQMGSYAAGGTLLFLLCVLSDSADRWILVVLAFLARSFEMGGTCVTWVSTAEILDTEVRTTGHGAANAVGRLGGMLCPYVVAGNTPLVVVAFVMLLVHGFTMFCASQLPETQGKALGSGFKSTKEIPLTASPTRPNELGVIS